MTYTQKTVLIYVGSLLSGRGLENTILLPDKKLFNLASLFGTLKGKIILVLFGMVTLASGGVVGMSFITPHTSGNVLAARDDSGLAVLAAEDTDPNFVFNVNVPSFFKEDATFEKNVNIKGSLNVVGRTTFEDGIDINGQDLDLGAGKLTATNVLYTLAAGSGISVTSGQDPTIANTGVLSVQDKTGDIDFTAGNGIAIDGLTFTNADRGSAQNIFKTIAVAGQTSIAASSNTDTLTIAGSGGITVTTDPTGKVLTIADSGGGGGVSSQWTTSGLNISYTDGNVGIGSTSPTEALDIVGNFKLSGVTTLNGLSYTWPGSRTNGYVLQTNGSGVLSWVDPASFGTNYWQLNSGAVSPLDITNDLLLGGTSTSSALIKLAGTSGGNSFFTGNVGIGTSIPSKLLEVNGVAKINTGLVVSKIYPPSDSGTAITFTKANGSTAVMYVDTSSSRVGIGIVPNAAFEVSSGNNSGLFIDSSNASALLVRDSSYNQIFKINGSTRRAVFNSTSLPGASLDIVKYSTDDYLSLDSIGGAGGDIFTVKNSGNVGIGSTNPQAKLDIAGNIIASGTLTGLTGLTSSGTITLSGLATNGGLLYTNTSGVLSQSSAITFDTTYKRLNIVPDVSSTYGLDITYAPTSSATPLRLNSSNNLGYFHETISNTNTQVNLGVLGSLGYVKGFNDFFVGSGNTKKVIYLTAGGNVGIGGSTQTSGVANPQALVHIEGGQTGGNVLLLLNQIGASTNDIFTASSSGATKFTIDNSGRLYLADATAPSSATNMLYSAGGTLYWNGSTISGLTGSQWTTNGSSIYYSTGNVAIGTSTASNQLTLNAPVTADSLATALFTSSSSSNKALVLQGATSQTASLLELQDPSGAVLSTFDKSGQLTVTSNYSNIPNYNNSGGTGDRTSIITASEVGNYVGCSSSPSILVNGVTNTGQICFTGSLTSSKYVEFDFGSAKVITEVKQYFGGTLQTTGTWKWQGSNDNATWTDIGGSYVMGGGSTQTVTTMSSNTDAYRYYRVVGVSGSGNSGVFWSEIEFKLTTPSSSGNTVVAGGYLGVGTSTLTHKLNIVGTVPGKALSMLNETGGNDIFTASSSGATKFTIDNSGRVYLADASAPTDTTNKLYATSGDLYWNGSQVAMAGSSSGPWTQTGSDVNFAGGNVGIGVSNPDALLEVSGSSQPTILYDFEDGTIDPFTTSGNLPWATDTSSKNNGTYSARSGAIAGSQSTTMTLIATISAQSTLSFARQVSSEAGFDKLTFAIDSVTQNQWSGSVSWSTVSYTLTPGTHTLTWTYSKDSGGVSGSDAAWVDDVTISPIGSPNFVFTSTGNMGIGTVSPVAKFDLLDGTAYLHSSADTADSLLKVSGSAKGKPLVVLNQTGTQDILSASTSGTRVFSLDSAGRLYLANATAPSTTTNMLYANGGNLFWNGGQISGLWIPSSTNMYFNSGNVGIGTTNATAAKFGIIGGSDMLQSLVRANATQTGNLQEWQRSDGGVIAGVNNSNLVVYDINSATSYTNTGGKGDRQSSITVTSDLTINSGSLNQIVNGLYSLSSTNDWLAFDISQSVSGKSIQFDFGTPKVISEVNWNFYIAASNGTWKWQGSNDASNWTDIGGSFTWGTSNPQVMTSLSSNTTAYRYYRMLGLSGTTYSSTSFTRTLEVEFKIANSAGAGGTTLAGGYVGIGSDSSLTHKLTVAGAVTGKALAVFNETGDQALFTASVSGITKFVIDHSGNVGIGTTSTRYQLTTNGSIGTVAEGDIFSQYDSGDAASYPVIARYFTGNGSFPGGTYIFGSGTNGYVGIEKPGGGDVTKFQVKATNAYFNNNIGIGSTTPAFPLDVANTVSSTQTYGFLNSSGGTGTATGTNTYSIRATGRVLASEFNAVSDARLKNVQFDLSPDVALNAISQLKPVSFTWKSTPDGQPILGFLAQDVEGVIPNAVSQMATVNFPDQRELDYNQLIAVSIGAIKQLNTNYNSLSQKLGGTTQPQSYVLQSDFDSLKSQVEEMYASLKSATLSASVMPLDAKNLDIDSATISGVLNVSGRTTVNDLGVTGTINAGLLTIDGLNGKLDTIGQPLQIQSLAVASIELENGQVVIDTKGNIVSSGTVTAKEIKTTKLTIIDTAEASDSAVMTKSIGSVVVKAGQSSVDVSTSALTPKSYIFVTPDTPVAIASKKVDSDTFRITLSQPANQDITVNWWIVN